MRTLKSTVVLLAALLVLSMPVAAATRTGSVGVAGQKVYGFIPPVGGAQAIVTVSWTQRLNTALVVLVCGDQNDSVSFGASGNLNSDRTARIEAGVVGTTCVVGVQGFGGQVNFRLNLQMAAEESPVKMAQTAGEEVSLRSHSTRLVSLRPADAPMAVRELKRLKRTLNRQRSE